AEAVEIRSATAQARELEPRFRQAVPAGQEFDPVDCLNVGVDSNGRGGRSLIDERPQPESALRAQINVAKTGPGAMMRLDVIHSIAGFLRRQRNDERQTIGGAGLRGLVLEFDRNTPRIPAGHPDADGVAGPDTHDIAHLALDVDASQRGGYRQVRE